MVAFEAFLAPTLLAAPAIPTQYKGSELSPPSRRPAPRRQSHVTAPDLLMTAPLN